MKKFLGILALFVLAISVFVSIPKKASAGKNIFDKGTQDEKEIAKQKSLEIIKDKAAKRGIGNADNFKVKKVDIDELKMAHTRFQQTVDDIPVWEGEAIVHLNPDGEILITERAVLLDTRILTTFGTLRLRKQALTRITARQSLTIITKTFTGATASTATADPVRLLPPTERSASFLRAFITARITTTLTGTERR